MDDKYEINIQGRLSETLMTCLTSPMWMGARNVNPIPRYCPSIATPNSVQGTDTKVLGNKPYDLAQKYHNRSPRVFEIKVTDPVPGGRRLVRPNVDQARTLCRMAKLGCRLFLCINLADDYSVDNPEDILKRADQFAVCTVEEYREICKQKYPILYFPIGHPQHLNAEERQDKTAREIPFQTLTTFLTSWVTEKPSKNFNMRTAMIPFSGKVITAYAEYTQAVGIGFPRAVGVTRGTQAIGVFVREEFSTLQQIIEEVSREHVACDGKLENQVIAAIERATSHHTGIEPKNVAQATRTLKKAADNRRRRVN